MSDQPRYEPFEQSSFFADQASVRPRIVDTVARGHLRTDQHLYAGRVDGRFAETFPFTVTVETVERGRERYDIFCAPCHGLTGEGNGIVIEYGLRKPPSFHEADVRSEPTGYYFALITDGARVMPSYAARILPEDRWAIVAYIRALQLSQSADAAQLPADVLPNLGASATITN